MSRDPRHRAAQPARARAAGVRRGAGSRAHRPLPHRPQHDRRALAAVRQSRPVPGLREPDHVRQAPHHLDHRLVGRRNHLGQAHLRADLPPREDRGGLHRGRRLPPLRPRRHEGQGRRGGAEGQPELHPFQRRRQRARHAGGGVRGIRPQGQRQDPHLRPRRRGGEAPAASPPGTFTDWREFAGERPALLRRAARLRRHRQRSTSPGMPT